MTTGAHQAATTGRTIVNTPPYPSLRIVHLYPDLLNLYGDIGNIIALQQRAQRRGINCEIIHRSVGDPLDADEFDILFIGGGQDSQQETVGRDLIKSKKAAITQAADNNQVILAICGGYQLLGHSIELHSGAKLEGLHVIDVETRVGQGRLIGDTIYEADFLGEHAADMPHDPQILFGFENHGSRTYLGPQAQPLAKVLHGKGNNGEDAFEGARRNNVFCTYSHGSFLPKNPAMTDYLLEQALSRRMGQPIRLAPVDSTYELEARRLIFKRLEEK